MFKKNVDISCSCRAGQQRCCDEQTGNMPEGTVPLAAACNSTRYRVCRVGGDRRTCARMAQLGVLPGCELELVCPGPARQCLVRVKGCTLSLDQQAAEAILVAPA